MAVAVVAVAALSLVSASWAQAGVPPAQEPSAVAVEAYLNYFDVSRGEAIRRLRLQARAADLHDVAREALGREFGGVWFDNKSGRYGVGATSASALGAAESVVRERGIEADTDLQTVSYATADLERSAKALPARLGDLYVARKVTTGVDDRLNAVVFRVSSEASASDRQRIALIAGSEPVRTVLQDAPASEFTAAPTVCAFPYCSRPLRGGVRINGPTSCTAGFVAFNQAVRTDRYVVTAGHCNRTLLATWSSFRVGCCTENIGPSLGSYANAFGDAGTIQASGPWNGTMNPWIVVWNRDFTLNTETYGLIDRRTSVLGTLVCNVGVTSGIECGVVLRRNVDPGYATPPDDQIANLTETSSCSRPGDSGGPVTAYNYAYGVTSGGTPNCQRNGNDRHYYTEITEAELILGVRIVTNATGPA